MPDPIVHIFFLFFAAVAAVFAKRTRHALPACLAVYAVIICASLVAPELMWPVVRKEGVLEATTEGVLLAWLVTAIRLRMPFAAVAGAVLFLEEVDYGQMFIHYPTPEFVDDASPKSDRMNFHNIPALGFIWRPGAFAAVWLLSGEWCQRQPWSGRLLKYGIPTFGRAHWFFLAVLGLAVCSYGLLGQHIGDETHEMFMVSGAWLLWLGRGTTSEWHTGMSRLSPVQRPLHVDGASEHVPSDGR